jgi:hypothetical protein
LAFHFVTCPLAFILLAVRPVIVAVSSDLVTAEFSLIVAAVRKC